MKKDIPFLPVENVYVAITKETTEINEIVWNAHLINSNSVELNNILVSSKGYGYKDGQKQETSILRHHFSHLGPEEHVLIELIDPSVFHLNNEYWISYFIGDQVFDKKFIFLPDTIIEENLIFIPSLNHEGILHS
ncbi:MAG: hypothetical protein ACK4ND_04275 [Cytophagaceae bacterium]